MPPSYLMPDVIVCIPGITGSVLRKDGRDVWNVSGGAVFNALRTLGGNLQDLKLDDDPVDVDDVDGIQATSVIRDVHLIPGIWQIDGYTKLVDHIKEKFAVTDGREPTSSSRTTGAATTASRRGSWRRRRRLARRRGAEVGQRERQADLIGHSMGGLVARHFLECREGWRDTRAADHDRHAVRRRARLRSARS